MSMNQHDIIGKYLQAIGVMTREFFHEMEDHILSSFENRKDKTQTLQEHIRDEVQPSFGGVKKILSIEKTQMNARRKLIWKRFFQILMSYLLGWPNMIITAGVSGVVYISSLYINNSKLFGISLALWFILVFVFMSRILWYSYQCKTKKKYYKTSQVYSVLGNDMSLFISIPNVVFQLFTLSGGSELLMKWVNSPILTIPGTVLLILFFISSQKLYKEEFRLQIQALN